MVRTLRLTGRFWIAVLLVFYLILAGMGTLRGDLIILAIPILIYLAISLLGRPPLADIHVNRSLSDRVVPQSGEVVVTIRFINQGEKIDELYVRDVVPEGLDIVEGEVSWQGGLRPEEEFVLEYTVRCVRGRFVYHNLHLEAGDHFGIFVSQSEVRAAGEFQVNPELPKLRNIKILPMQTRGFFGPIPSRNRGAGMVFWGVREFHLGDPLRQVNWKVSSRHQEELFTNEFEMERIADVGLILDARRQTDLKVRREGFGEESLFEYSVMATATLADAFLSDGHRVSMLIYGYGLDRVYPGYGKIQRERILHALTGAEPGSNYALENFNYLPTRLFPAHSQLVVVSPVDRRDLPAYTRLRRNGYEVMVVSPNPILFVYSGYQPSPILDRALRLANVERNLFLRRLTRLGIQVIDWSVDQPFDKTIHSFLGRQPIYRRNLKMVVR